MSTRIYSDDDVPKLLPQTKEDFYKWATLFMKKHNLYTKNALEDLANMILELPRDVSHVPDNYFLIKLRATISKSVAISILDEIKGTSKL